MSEGRVVSPEEVKEEDRKIRRLQWLVRFALAYIAQANITLEECQRTVAGVKRYAMELFPGKEETFDLIYLPRFRRVIAEKFRLD
ncbi:hypothetical protein [Thermodesulforhabdus norvegica]|uniref:Uncharacterized protein n=1 Tax=Thermodesulforhabdus norvegica TaxID=39841 RepID=A0A1I4VZJ7_9BACT|nr:hypothetical protein [Thermodesulforhabdus norvegica]SFN06437.1 hypothetical protein SAMN05660836_02533 [Thermodesulforhabdus norvegica]